MFTLVPCNKRDASIERRTRLRFPLSVSVKYIYRGCQGSAVARDISSHGICLEGLPLLPVGSCIKLVFAWAAQLDGHIPLSIVVRGKVLRSDGDRTAVSILKHEFRLRPIKVGTASGSNCNAAAS
jgi:PilZ domain-containing protein